MSAMSAYPALCLPSLPVHSGQHSLPAGSGPEAGGAQEGDEAGAGQTA